jgi:hypothetical protein
MILASANPDPIVAKLGVLFAAMSHHRLSVTAFLSSIYEVDVMNAKYCFELGLQSSRHFMIPLHAGSGLELSFESVSN